MTVETFAIKSDLKFSAGKGKSLGTISGYWMKYNIPSGDRGGFKAIFSKGAFDTDEQGNFTNNGRDIKAFREHPTDGGVYLGRTNNLSLTFSHLDDGEWFDLQLPDTNAGRDTLALYERGDYTGMSFGVNPDFKRTTTYRDGDDVLMNYAGELDHVALVADPAFADVEFGLELYSRSPVTADHRQISTVFSGIGACCI